MSAVNPSYVSVDMDLSFNTANYASPNFQVVNCRDVEMAVTWGEADVSNRGAKLDLKEPALQVRELTWDMVADETDAVFTAVRVAALGRSVVDLVMANGPVGTALSSNTGGTANIAYSRCLFKIFGMKRGEPLEGAATVSFTAKPCKAAQATAPVDNTLIV